MKQLNLDLGESYDERYSQPVGPGDSKDKKHYPSFTYHDDEESLDIPDRGKMLIEYEEIRRVESKEGDRENYECTIAVRKILGVEGDKKKDTKAGDALDAIREALEKEAGESDHDGGDEDGDEGY
jgi:hypothetical protein